MNRAAVFSLTLLAVCVTGKAALSQKVDAVAYSNRCADKVGTADFRGAFADCTKAIQLNPGDAISYSNRSGARGAIGDSDGAIADATAAIQLGLSDAYFNRGSAKRSKGDLNGAIADLDKDEHAKGDEPLRNLESFAQPPGILGSPAWRGNRWALGELAVKPQIKPTPSSNLLYKITFNLSTAELKNRGFATAFS